MTIASTRAEKTAPGSTNDDDRWAAVARRDRNADGAFFYSVRTTGVYCRPGCAARLAHRSNVRFHPSCDAAEAAGFRPCKRCRPRDVTLAQAHAAAVSKACRLIESAPAIPDLDSLADLAGMSRFHFHRTFKSVTGVTPKAYAAAYRSRRVRNALAASGTVTEAIYSAGFGSSGRFYANAAESLGMKPSAYRKGGDGMSIRFAVGECSLGSILVAATDVGICSILLGDDPDALVRDLQDRFPKAEMTGGDRQFERWVAAVVGFVDAPAAGLGLPLDLRGTAFQHRVWQALCEIRPGATLSYTEIAKRIGAPKAVRAVAHACASNPVAVAIPCHRAVRVDGGLAGYRWGIERKRNLLERERAGSLTVNSPF